MVMNAADELQGSYGAVFIIYANDNMSPVCEISVNVRLRAALHFIDLDNFIVRISRKWIKFVLLLNCILFIWNFEMFPIYFPR
jgi:hypothetical protein